MRILKAIGTAMAVLPLSVAAYGQPITTTVLVDWNDQGGGLCSTFTGTRNTTFMHTAGSNWSSLKIRIPLDLEQHDIKNPTQPGPPSTFSAAINSRREQV